MLAWRDIKHPAKGGAEIVTDVYLNGLAKLGHDVTLFTSRYKDSKEQDKINNYKVIRKGNKLTVSLHGLLYAKKHEKDYDIIIDQVNTLPFFTPLLIKKEKRVLFSHQLCKNIWPYEMMFPFSYVGYAIESIYLKFYRNTRAFTVSNSSKQDLVKYANINPKNILVLDNQINFQPINHPKEKENHFVFCGRLTASKRQEEAIKALSIIKDKNTKLYIIGPGNEKYKNQLKELTNKLNLSKRVIFTGSISNQERNKLMQKALAIIVTSVREGWGLIVTEANANGTIAITYNIEGLRDANTSKTGFITKENTPEEIAKYMDLILNNKELTIKKSKEAIKFAKAHSNWNNQVRRLEQWLRR